MTITASSPWRTTGAVPWNVFANELMIAQSPMIDEAREIWEAADDLSRLMLAMSWVEQKHGTWTASPIPARYRNPFSLKAPADPKTGDRPWMTFSNYAQGVRAWRDRITSETYGDGIYARTTSIADLIRVYAPPNDNNNTERYIADVVAIINRLPHLAAKEKLMAYPTYPVLMDAKTGATIQVESPVPIVQKLIPTSKPWIRPGLPLRSPWQWIQHETGNPRPGANAEMHYRYLMGLPAGTNVSFHFVVDDGQIIQLIPCNEVTWQAADGSGPGNMACVSCELCINSDGDKALARRNAEWLCGGVLKANQGTTADIKRHWDFNAGTADRHHCPDLMMNENYWPTFVANVGKVISGPDPTPPKPTFAKRFPPPLPPTTQLINDQAWIKFGKTMVAIEPAPALQFAMPDADPVAAPFPMGKRANFVYIVPGSDGQPWFVSKNGTRTPARSWKDG